MQNRLQELRWNKNWSQVKLAARSGVSRALIAKIENDQTANPSIQTAILLSRALCVDIEAIFIL